MCLDFNIAELILVSAGLFGLIFGVVFLSDGWYAAPESSGFLGNSPKVRGLLFLLGGSVIPIFTDLFSPAGDDTRGYATVVYAAILGITTVIGVFILAVYAFIISISVIHDLVPSRWWVKICIDALRFAFIAVRKGSTYFYEELNEEYNKVKKLRHQREHGLTFFNGMYTAMVDNNVNHISGVDNFVRFVTRYLEYFVNYFLTPYSNDDVKYRACIYFHDRDGNIQPGGQDKLYYFVGVDPMRSTRFSRASFSFQESFAGWVIQNSADRSTIFPYIRGNGTEGVPFQERQPIGPYKSLVLYAIRPLIARQGVLPRMVLCIDCSKPNLGIFSDHSEDREYVEQVLVFLCTAIATAQASMDVPSSDERRRNTSIASWIKRNYPNP